MTKIVSVAEAKRDLTMLLRDAESKRTEVVITRRGKPVSALLSFEEYAELRKLRAYMGMLRISKELESSGITATELFEESRKELEDRS